MTTISGHTTRANGTILTAAIYNADHVNHVTNAQALNATKMEGATPPVVDGQAVVWSGTSGNALRTGGYFPANESRSIIAGTGLTGGGNLSADRTLAVDFASQAEAEAAASIIDVMSPLRVKQLITFILATQAEAEAGADNTKLMTPLRVAQRQTIMLASNAEAVAGVENTKTMTALRVAQAVAVLAPPAINIGAALVLNATPVDTGVDDVGGAAFMFKGSGLGAPQVSCDGGTNYTSIAGGSADTGIVYIKNGVIAVFSGSTLNVQRFTTTAGAGNIFFRSTGGGTNGTVIRIM